MPQQHMFLFSLHSVVYQWGLANYRSIRYGGVIVSNEICLTIRRSNWARLSLQFTLSRRCVALWWIIAPVWLTTVMSIASVEPLQPWRPTPTKRTAPAHIGSNPCRSLVRLLSIFWRNFKKPCLFGCQESSWIHEKTRGNSEIFNEAMKGFMVAPRMFCQVLLLKVKKKFVSMKDPGLLAINNEGERSHDLV